MAVRLRSLALLVVLAGASSGAESERCTIATRSDSVIRDACDRGGREEASRTMRQIVKQAYKRGIADYKCTRCHQDLEAYDLRENARDDLARILVRLTADTR